MISPRTKFRLEQFPGSLSPRWSKEEAEIAREKGKKKKLEGFKSGNWALLLLREEYRKYSSLFFGKWETADVLLLSLPSKLVCN